MRGPSIIATVLAAGGILIAGSVASVAVINAASSSQPDSETIRLVVAGDAATAGPEPSTAAALPAVPESSDAPTRVAAAADQPQPSDDSAETSSPASSDDSATRQGDSPRMLTADQARGIVLEKGRGSSIISTSRESRKGYSTWAVRIARSNGEILTGYVDRASGVVVDWTVNRKASATQATPSASDDDDRADDADDDDDDRADDYEDYEDD